MSKKPVVLAALAAAIAAGSPTTAKEVEPSQSTPTAVSIAARDAIVNRVTPASTPGAHEKIAAKKKFKLFDNGPSFVKSVKKKIS